MAKKKLTSAGLPKHQTVGWLIEQLKTYDPNTQIGFANGPGEELLALLSDYLSDDKSVVVIDIGI